MPGKFFLYPFQVGEKIVMKKTHPCKGKIWDVLRVGAEVNLQCQTCKKMMAIPRAKLEKMCANIISADDRNEIV